jgi:hypothetical protein
MNGASEVFDSMLHGKGVDWASQATIMAITGNRSSTMKTNIIVFTLTLFKSFWCGSTSRKKF